MTLSKLLIARVFSWEEACDFKQILSQDWDSLSAPSHQPDVPRELCRGAVIQAYILRRPILDIFS